MQVSLYESDTPVHTSIHQSPPRSAWIPAGLPPASLLAWGTLLAPTRHSKQQKGQTLLCVLFPGLMAASSQDRHWDSHLPQQPCPASSLPWLLLAPVLRPLSFPKSRSGILWPVFMAIMNMVKINACIFNVSINKGKQSPLLT